MTTDRFHRAARDGYLDALKEATRRDCNTPDEDGLTPTLLAAYEGKLDALRLIVGRGGDPDKSDHYGNTALHCAATRGHMNCVSFLVNFGANLWALDNDLHVPKDLAAINNREEILRYLDTMMSEQESLNKKMVKQLREKAYREAEKRIKEFEKIQKKMDKKKEKEEKKMLKERKQMERCPEDNVIESKKSSIKSTFSKGTITSLLKENRPTHVHNSKFSDLVNVTGTQSRRNIGMVSKKVQQKKDEYKADFKIREEGEEKKSLRSLQGLKRDEQILYVPKDSDTTGGKRGKISDVFDTRSEMSRAISEPDFLYSTDSGYSEDNVYPHEQTSIFNRPGFGSVAFRSTIVGTFNALPPHLVAEEDENDHGKGSDKNSDHRSANDSIGSAGSLAQRNNNLPWDDEDLPSDDEPEATPLWIFLNAASLYDYIPQFTKEKIDLESLMLLSEGDLIGMGIPLGPRKKLIKAIEERKVIMGDPGIVEDSRL